MTGRRPSRSALDAPEASYASLAAVDIPCASWNSEWGAILLAVVIGDLRCAGGAQNVISDGQRFFSDGAACATKG